MEKSEFSVLIKHYFLIRKKNVQAKQWPDKCYPNSTLSRQIVKKWFADFKRVCRNTDDAEVN